MMDNPKKEDIIIEIGSEFIRMGVVSDRTPRKCIKSAEYFKHENKSEEKYASMMEELLYNIFFAYINSPCQGKTVIILQKVYTDRKVLETIAKIMFRKLKVEKIELALSCVTPLYLSAMYHGLVVSAGASAVEIMPVYEGIPILCAFQCIEEGTSSLNRLVRSGLMALNPETSKDIFMTMSESDISDIRNIYAGIPASDEPVTITHKRSRFKFVPSKIHFDGLFGDVANEEHNMAYSFLKAIQMLPQSCLEEVVKNVVLAGGLWRIKGIQKYFKKAVLDMLPLFPTLHRLNLHDKIGTTDSHAGFVSWSFNPSDVSWIGCSIGASIRSIEHLSLKRSEYLDKGYVEKVMQAYFMAT